MTSNCVQTIAGYVAMALDNAQLYYLAGAKGAGDRAPERFQRKHRGIAERRRARRRSWRHRGIVEHAHGATYSACSGTTRLATSFARCFRKNSLRRLLRAATKSRSPASTSSGCIIRAKYLTLNVSITPLVSKSGDRIGRLLLFDDVTQRERMEEQMSQTEKLTSLGLLAAGVAHEVNTPLAVISNYIQMLAKQMPEGDPRQGIIEKIVKQTFRASEIVNNLLNFSRTSATEAADIDVNRVVEETLVTRGAPAEDFADPGGQTAWAARCRPCAVRRTSSSRSF